MDKRYIILGDNNFWYATFTASTIDEIAIEVQNVMQNLDKFEDAAFPPDKLYVYEATPCFDTVVNPAVVNPIKEELSENG